MYSYLAARSFYSGFGVSVSEFDLAYPVLVARVVALLALVLVITCVGQIGAAPYDWWLRRYLHRKFPTGPIPGGAVVSSVVVFGLAPPLQ